MKPDRPKECSNCDHWGGRADQRKSGVPLQSASCGLTMNEHGVMVRGSMAHADAEYPVMCWLETQAEFCCCQWKEVQGA